VNSSRNLPALIVAAAAHVMPVLAATSIQSPQLVGFHLAPTLVDTSDSNQTITVTIRVTAGDPGIGPSGGVAFVDFLSPSSKLARLGGFCLGGPNVG